MDSRIDCLQVGERHLIERHAQILGALLMLNFVVLAWRLVAVGQAFLDRYEAEYDRRPPYCVPVMNRDFATVLLHAFAGQYARACAVRWGPTVSITPLAA